MKKDYYSLLGVTKDSSQGEIKAAYRKLALKFHPDKNPGDPFFEKMFREVKEAYETLSDEKLRADYDSGFGEKLSNHKTSSPNPAPQPPSETQVLKTIISNLRKFDSQTKGSAKRQIKTEVISKYLDQILAKEILRLYDSVSSDLKREFVFAVLPLLRFFDKKTRENYLLKLIGIAGPDNELISQIDFKMRGFIKNQKLKDFKVALSENAWVFVVLGIAGFIFYFSSNETGSSGDRNSRNVVVDNEPELNQKVNKWNGNQLNTGDSPYNDFFGEGVYDKRFQNKVKIHNGQKADVIVCLTEYDPPYRTIRNEYIRAGESFEMTSIPNGVYYLKSFFGNDWNPDTLYLGKIKGFFETNSGFSKSDKYSDLLRLVQDDSQYSIFEITLYPVVGGNMESENINANEFFGN